VGRYAVVILVSLAAFGLAGCSHGDRRENGALLFSSNRGSGNWFAYVTDASGASLRRVVAVDAFDSTCRSPVVWSRNGERMAYPAPSGGVFRYDVRTRRKRDLVPDGSSCDSYQLSPDGSELVFTDLEGGPWLADHGGRRGLGVGGEASEVAWSPDGSRIAFVDDENNYSLDVGPADGSSTKPVAFGVLRQPVWSPDAKRLAYVTGDVDGESVHVIAVDGSRRHTLSLRPGKDPVIDWSPDGKRVVFSDSTGAYVIDGDGSNRRKVGRGGWTSVSWSPDGRMIAYTAGHPSAAWLADPDGTHARRLSIDLPFGGDVENVSWNPASIPVRAIAGTPVHVPRSRQGEPTGPLVAFFARTGARAGRFPSVSGGRVDAIITDGHGGWFIGGAFSHVGGILCSRLAHVLSSFRVDRAFCGRTQGEVQSLAKLGGTLYIAGQFQRLAGVRRLFVGALDRSGKLLAWQPLRGHGWSMDVGNMAVAVRDSRVYLSGPFSGDIGQGKREQLAAVDPVTAALEPWAPRVSLAQVGLHYEGTIDALAASTAAVYCYGVNGGFAVYAASSGRQLHWLHPERIWAFALRANTLFLGGGFSRFQSAPRHNLAAVDATTGTHLPWAPSEPDRVLALGTSPTIVWAAVTVAGHTRLDGFDIADARLQPAHITVRGGNVAAIAATRTLVLVGGDFESAKFR
jgi:Tol biopolymer transport system component